MVKGIPVIPNSFRSLLIASTFNLETVNPRSVPLQDNRVTKGDLITLPLFLTLPWIVFVVSVKCIFQLSRLL
jgi:hypothetical protein